MIIWLCRWSAMLFTATAAQAFYQRLLSTPVTVLWGLAPTLGARTCQALPSWPRERERPVLSSLMSLCRVLTALCNTLLEETNVFSLIASTDKLSNIISRFWPDHKCIEGISESVCYDWSFSLKASFVTTKWIKTVLTRLTSEMSCFEILVVLNLKINYLFSVPWPYPSPSL